jgi:hypothetical protein
MKFPSLEQRETASGPVWLEYARAADTSAEAPIDVHDLLKTQNIPAGVSNPGHVSKALGKMVEVDSWLPFAAESYNISSKFSDFVVVPTTIFLTDIPNANLAAFPFEAMSAWNPQAGQITYRTWERKPTHVEHANSDHTQARGVILDASMRKVPNYLGDLHRVVLLAAWDRNRDAPLVNKILAGRSGFSMGAWVGTYHCGCCGHDMRHGACAHLVPTQHGPMPRVREVGNKLVYRVAGGAITGFELSAVASPAWRSAWGVPIDSEFHSK